MRSPSQFNRVVPTQCSALEKPGHTCAQSGKYKHTDASYFRLDTARKSDKDKVERLICWGYFRN